LPYPKLVHYDSEEAYRHHFEEKYCRGPIATFDRIKVRFQKRQFRHCFFESSRRDKIKDRFSSKRAERIDWIKAALRDANSERYIGWDNKHKRLDKKRRVAIVCNDYVVVIRMTGTNKANFITAFVADTEDENGGSPTLDKIRKSPKWK